MAKKVWTPEERRAFAEKMRLAKAAKKDQEAQYVPAQELAQEPATEQKVELTQEQFKELMDRLARVEDTKTSTQSEATPPSHGFDQFGKPVGIMQKYSVDPSHYNDPRDGLASLRELDRFAFKSNYMLDWDVEQIIYDTKYGTAISEPKFTLVLWRRMFDDNGEPSNKRMFIQRGIFHEDPAAAVKIALELGLPIDSANTKPFLEDMRFQRYRQWLFDIFFPQKADPAREIREEVINGKVVQIETYNEVIT